MKFIPQLTIPSKGDPYYNTKSNGGYSRAIKGSPVCDGLDVLSNCVGWATSRFAVIANDPSMHYLAPVNAEEFIEYADESLKIGTTPKLGACMVWKRIGYHGHVAIVEQINEDGSIVTSESGYGVTPAFYTKVRKPTENWGQPSDYTFLGFIYQPTEFEQSQPNTPEVTFPVTAVRKGSKGDDVKRVQTILKGLGMYTGIIDSEAGVKTVAAIKSYQQKNKLYLDGIWAEKCWEHWFGLN